MRFTLPIRSAELLALAVALGACASYGDYGRTRGGHRDFDRHGDVRRGGHYERERNRHDGWRRDRHRDDRRW